MDEFSPFPQKKTSWLPWALVGALAAGILALLFLGLMPAQSRGAELEKHMGVLNKEVNTLKGQSREDKQQLATLQNEKDALTKESANVAEKLNSAIKEKEAAVAELQEAQRDLTSTLDKQITAGDVLIQERHGELVVDVSDKLLFDKGQADINDAGKELLAQVAKSIRRLPPKLRFQVGGHTDSQKVVSPELVERFPTNWELSTARASNVVRYLQETGKVPGSKLIAAGFAQFRPASTNNTESGRQKNRRIEIVIVMPKE
jgi:chemotaxis protein MotB